MGTGPLLWAVLGPLPHGTLPWALATRSASGAALSKSYGLAISTCARTGADKPRTKRSSTFAGAAILIYSSFLRKSLTYRSAVPLPYTHAAHASRICWAISIGQN